MQKTIQEHYEIFLSHTFAFFDLIDFIILKNFCKKKSMTVSQLWFEICKNFKVIGMETVRKRLNKILKYGILEKTENSNPKIYTLRKDAEGIVYRILVKFEDFVLGL